MHLSTLIIEVPFTVNGKIINQETKMQSKRDWYAQLYITRVFHNPAS